MSTVKPLGVLFQESVTFTQSRLSVLLAGAVVFALMTQGISWWTTGSVAGIPGMQGMGAWQEQMQQMGGKMEELQKRAASGQLDAATQAEMEALTQQMAQQGMQGMGMMGSMLGALMPALGLSLVLSLLLGAVAKSYYLLVAVKGLSDPMAAASATANSIVPLVGLWIWMFLRSFVWIPLIGIVFAIVLWPRFVLAPLELLEHGKGVFESVRLSHRKTAGLWAKIVGNILAVGIATMVCAWILGAVLSGILGSMIGGFLAAVIQQFAGAFVLVFSIRLARSILEHPAHA